MITKWNEFLSIAQDSNDFKHYPLLNEESPFVISYYQTLIKTELLQKNLLRPYQERLEVNESVKDLRQLSRFIHVEDIIYTDDIQTVVSKIMTGYASIQPKDNLQSFALIPLLFLLFLLWGKKRSTALYQTPEAETEKAR